LPDAADLARRGARAALAGEGATGGVAILLTDDAAVRALNARFRHRDAATNVLSFPGISQGPTAGGHLGDIALAFGVCAREAAEQGKPLAHHLTHLVIHGVLHLLGYDHQESAEAERMESLERALLKVLGAPDPYAAEFVSVDRGGHVQHRQ
jgi:probable rRNA maturation factor